MSTGGSGKGARRSPQVQSVERAAGLLKQLGRIGRPASLSELAAASGLQRATAWRILTTLEQAGFVERASPAGGFALGQGLVAITASVFGDCERLARLTRPHLESLARDTGLSAAVSMVRGGRVVVLDQADPPSVVSVNWVGKEFPMHTSSPGKLLLAALPARELDEFLSRPLERLTKKTITNPACLRAELEQVRRTGVAVSDEEFEEGCVGVSASVEDPSGALAAIVTLTGPVFRMQRRRFPTLRAQVLETARMIEATLYGNRPLSRSL
jgi:DNA-binding IclR family transcriptional regulator